MHLMHRQKPIVMGPNTSGSAAKEIFMRKKLLNLGMLAVTLTLAFLLAGCPDPVNFPEDPSDPDDTLIPVERLPPEETIKSSNAKLSGITIKGVAVNSLGTPHATLDSVRRGTGIITNADSGATAGTAADSKASVTKIVQYASGGVVNAGTFTEAAAYNNESVNDNDFFVFEVTAENGVKLYYRIAVKVATFSYRLALYGAESNISNAEDPANVRFFVHNELTTYGFYNDTTYAQAVELFGEPVKRIYSLNAYDDGLAAPAAILPRFHTSENSIDKNYLYLYAFEFSGPAANDTLVKFGVNPKPLTGSEQDIDIQIDLNKIVVLTPPSLPPEEISDDPVLYLPEKQAK